MNQNTNPAPIGDETTCLQSYSGRRYYPLRPDASVVCIADIAHSLAMQCRFHGHCRDFYSVAEHCVRGLSLVLPQLQPYFLLHDAAEAYLIDLPRPVKRIPEFSWYRDLELRWLVEIAKVFDLNPDLLRFSSQVYAADDVMLATEKRDLNAEDLDCSWEELPDPAPEVIRDTWSPLYAEVMFLHAYDRLFRVTAPQTQRSPQ